MATIYKTYRKRRNPLTGRKERVLDAGGKPILHPKWRVTIVDHRKRRRTYTLSTSRQVSQKQADLLEQMEREIMLGLRPAPHTPGKRMKRSFAGILEEYMAWGRMQGGRDGNPWDGEHAQKKEKDMRFWRETLGLEMIEDAAGILPKVEAECRKMFEAGKSGKTVENRVQNLRAMFRWCLKRRYIQENPLQMMDRFNTSPTFVRRAMTVEEFEKLLRGCAPHRRLLYEAAACSGLRENELRRLEPKDLDRENCALRVDRMIDKGRIARIQFIPSGLMERLAASAEANEAKKLYTRIYKRQGNRENRNAPPRNPLLYVPSNSAAMLKRDLKAAGIPVETEAGRLDFHALRTAYVNFLLDVGAAPKELQDLARHKTLEMTMNIYGRARQTRKRGVVEALGEMLSIRPANADGDDSSAVCAAQ